MRKTAIAVLVVLALCPVLFAQAASEETASFVASTSWTASYADLAGVDALGNVLTGLVRPTTSVSDRSKLKIPRNHTQLGPAILGLGTHGGSSKQLELKLRALLLHH